MIKPGYFIIFALLAGVIFCSGCIADNSGNGPVETSYTPHIPPTVQEPSPVLPDGPNPPVLTVTDTTVVTVSETPQVTNEPVDIPTTLTGVT
jgi:hypothetical protein